MESLITKSKRQKRTILQNIQENQLRAAPHPEEKKAKAELKILAKKNKKQDWKKLPALSTAVHL